MHFQPTSVRELTVTRKQRLRFAYSAPEAKTVYLGGNFVPLHSKFIHMVRGKGGIWYAYVILSPGHYHYAFYVDGAEEALEHFSDNAVLAGAAQLQAG